MADMPSFQPQVPSTEQNQQTRIYEKRSVSIFSRIIIIIGMIGMVILALPFIICGGFISIIIPIVVIIFLILGIRGMIKLL